MFSFIRKSIFGKNAADYENELNNELQQEADMVRSLFNNPRRNVKCVLVGDDGVGKTCLVMRLAEHSFPNGEYVPTVYDTFTKSIKMTDLSIWDTTGREEYDRLRPLTYPQTNIFLICFDITNRKSFESCKTKFIPEIKSIIPGTPFILVGLKTDLLMDNNNNNNDISVITIEEAQETVTKYKGLAYMECTSKDDNSHSVEAVFETAVDFNYIKLHPPVYQPRYEWNGLK